MSVWLAIGLSMVERWLTGKSAPDQVIFIWYLLHHPLQSLTFFLDFSITPFPSTFPGFLYLPPPSLLFFFFLSLVPALVLALCFWRRHLELQLLEFSHDIPADLPLCHLIPFSLLLICLFFFLFLNQELCCTYCSYVGISCLRFPGVGFWLWFQQSNFFSFVSFSPVPL